MISHLNGRIADIEEDGLVIELGGIGLKVHVPAALRQESKPGNVVSLFTHMVVRETELSLYGFPTKEERHFFEMLIGVSGIGPRLGLAALSTLNPNAIRRAVLNEQSEIFSRIPGVGKKTAQKILLHLQDKITSVDGLEPIAAMDDVDGEVMAALTSMGFSVVESQAALQFIPKDAPKDIEERLKLALQYFSSP
ncbi:MAG: Holliday junction branch migration protein RuvA [Anaerolineae bacterium]|nr:Holliday junction branch migration protein RuvA [Anaerolineae bacterium]